MLPNSPLKRVLPKLQMVVRRRIQSQQPMQTIITTLPSATAVSTVSTATTATPIFSASKKVKHVRHTSSAAQQIRQNKLAAKAKYIVAFKKATTMYKNETEKPNDTIGKLSAEAVEKVVEKVVEKETKIRVPARSIQKAVKTGREGLSPLKQGCPGKIPETTFNHMANAFESYIKINQLNGTGGDISSSKLFHVLKQCTKDNSGCDCNALLKRLKNATATDINCGRSNNAEERRVRWTTYYFIKSWFDSWERDLLELEFA